MNIKRALTWLSAIGGTINNAIIGAITPVFGRFSPLVAKGPAIINSGFVGTLTAAASVNVTFSSAADAILCGYSATAPVLGGTLISNSLTRYITAWTNATTAVVDSAVTWAGTAITSVQLPISFEVTSAGVLKRATYADGTDYFAGNVGIGTTAPTGQVSIVASAANATNILTFGRESTQRWAISMANDYFNIKDVTQANANKLTIDLGGNVGIGTTVFGTSAVKNLVMGDGTAASSSPANAVSLYSEGGEAKVRDAAGNVTTFSPHHMEQIQDDPAVELPWTMHHSNNLIGIEQEVDMAGLVAAVELLTGKKFVYSKAIPKMTLAELETKRKADLAEKITAELTVDVEVDEKEAVDTTGGKRAVKEGIMHNKETGKYTKRVVPSKSTVDAEVAKAGDVLRLPKWVTDRIK